MSKPYCGSKAKPPGGRSRGSPGLCFKIGLRSGFKAGMDKQKELDKGKSVRKVKKSLTRAELTKKTLGELRAQLQRLKSAGKSGMTNLGRASKASIVDEILRVAKAGRKKKKK